MKQKKNELKSIKECNFLTGWLLCAAVVFSGLLPVSASGTASSYEIEGVVLKITVPGGVTNEVDVSELACANDNIVTEIRKLGRGGLLMNDKTAIPNYEGDIYVDQGTWIVASSNALGKLDVNSKGENTGKVYVADGASIDLASNDRYLNNKGKKITIKGHGVSGNGALTVSVNAANYYNQTLGNNLVLDGNSSIWMPYNFNLYLLDSNIDLAGHKLTVKGDGASSGNIVVGNEAAVKFGTLEFVNKGGMVLQSSTAFDDDCNLVFKDESKLAVKMSGRYDAPIIWDSTGVVRSDAVVKGDIINTWHGPVRLDKTMKVGISKNGTFSLAGKVEGAGGLDMYWTAETKPEIPTNVVTLANAGSTFEGGVSVRNLIVNVMESDAVPTEGGAFALTNSIVNFDLRKSYMLPNGIIHVDSGKYRTATGGLGKWKTLVKTGSGTVDYNSVIGADVLELKSGVMKISEQTYTSHRFAGLIEGVEYFMNDPEKNNAATKCQNATLNDEIVYTNGVVMSPYLMNTPWKNYWTTARPDWDIDNSVKAHCTTYSGYMWNREPTNVTWTFVCNVANMTVFNLGGEKLFSHTTSSSLPLTNVTVTVTPGAHRFRIGNYSKYHSNNPNNTEGGATDKPGVWKFMGLHWDPYGRGVTNFENFVKLVDPGDGSLFTWAIPGDDVFYPGTNESRKFDYLPEFDLVKFSGGTLHLNGITNTVSEVEGLPNMAGTGKLIIENKWTIDAADLADGSEVSGLSFGFGADAELETENSSAAKSMTGSREWTVIKSAEDITGSITVKDEDMAKRWSVKVDGNEVKLKYRPFGTAVIIR